MKNLRIFIFVLLTATTLSQVFAQKEENLPCVSNITAEKSAKAYTITLTWSLPEKNARANILFYAIYRDTKPIYSTTKLKQLEPVAAAQKNDISYTDTVTDNQNYYYAVIAFIKNKQLVANYEQLYYDEELDEEFSNDDESTLYAVVLPGVNSTITGIAAASQDSQPVTASVNKTSPDTKYETERQSAKSDEKTAARTQQEKTQNKSQTAGNKKSTISKESQGNVSSLIKGKKKPQDKELLKKYIFSQDINAPNGGDDYLLYSILSKTFNSNDYKTAISELKIFLSQRHDEKVTSRAIFYLGESYYMTGDFRNALKNFSMVKEEYPTLSSKWIDSCIDNY